ncbi:MAG TPA: DUF4136 domain-containing protein [Planctomycetota bacterium]|nr:DUF4136 domain-containing protein [Planctomycetota bacterium]
MHRAILVLALLVSAGCGGPRLTVDSDYEPSTDFSKFKTWSWMAGMKPSEKDIDSITQKRIREAIEAELPKRGIPKVDDGGDLSATYQISIQRKIETSSASVGVGYGWGPAHIGVSKSPTRTYDEGTLVLDLVDPKTKTLIWRGTAKGTVSPDTSPEERQEHIREAVAYLLEDYPPKNK